MSGNIKWLVHMMIVITMVSGNIKWLVHMSGNIRWLVHMPGNIKWLVPDICTNHLMLPDTILITIIICTNHLMLQWLVHMSGNIRWLVHMMIVITMTSGNI
jgi:hypothetical protein